MPSHSRAFISCAKKENSLGNFSITDGGQKVTLINKHTQQQLEAFKKDGWYRLNMDKNGKGMLLLTAQQVDDLVNFDPNKEQRPEESKNYSWPEGKVYFQFDPSLSFEQERRIKEEIDKIKNALGNHVAFIEGKGSGNYIKFVGSDATWSYLGMKGGEQVFALNGSLDFKSTLAYALSGGLNLTTERLGLKSKRKRDYVSCLDKCMGWNFWSWIVIVGCMIACNK